MGSFLSSGKFALCLAAGGAWGVGSRPTPVRRNLGGAKWRWPDPCQGRSRRRRWPKASLYKGLASDDDRRPRSVGRDYAHLSPDLSPVPTRMRTRPPLVDEPSAFLEAHMDVRALSGGFSTDEEARLSCGSALDDVVRGPRGGHRFGEAKIARGTIPRAQNHRATTLYSAGLATRTHDALMRIGGVVSRRRDHSLPRREGHGWVRVAAASDRCPARADTRSSREEETPFQQRAGEAEVSVETRCSMFRRTPWSRTTGRRPARSRPRRSATSRSTTCAPARRSSSCAPRAVHWRCAPRTIWPTRFPSGTSKTARPVGSCRAARAPCPPRPAPLPARAREPLSSGDPVRPP